MKNKAGRPTVITPEVTAKLVEAFKNDFTQKEACIYAGISQDAFQNRYANNKNFAAEMDGAKAFLFFIAKRNIAQAMAKDGDIESTWKFLSKRQKEIYSDRIEQTGKDGEKLINFDDLPDGNNYKKFLKQQAGKKDGVETT
jgi:hypothetical protein